MGVLLLVCIAILVQHGTVQTVIACSNGDVQLSPILNNNPLKGVVQLCNASEWRTVCRQDNQWNTHAANVVCRQLGYSDKGATARYICSPQDTSTKYIWITGCSGTENSLEECGHDEQTECSDKSCSGTKTRHANILCLSDNCANGEIRLVNGSTNREGRVEVCLDGRWGTVCNDNQEDLAGAVCSQLGLSAKKAQSSTFGRSGSVPVYNCTLKENNVTDSIDLSCSHTDNVNCTHSMDLGVVCQTHQEVIDQIINQTINETRQECTEPPPVTTLPVSCDKCAITDGAVSGSCEATSDGSALGAVIGVLVALLVAIVIGWICTCVFLRKRPSSSKQNISILGSVAYSTNQTRLDNPVYDGNEQLQTNYSSLGPAYELVDANKGAGHAYDVINCNRGNTSVNKLPTQNAESASPIANQDHNVLDHTDENPYHILEQPEGDQGDYEVPISEKTPRGLEVDEGEYSKLKR